MEIKNIKKVTPRFNYVITTADTSVKRSASGIIKVGTSGNGNAGSAETLDEYQKVIAVGEFLKAREHNDIKVNSIVRINLTQFAKRKYEEGSIKDNLQDMNPITEYNIPTIEMDGIKYLYLPDNAIDMVIDEYDI